MYTVIMRKRISFCVFLFAIALSAFITGAFFIPAQSAHAYSTILEGSCKFGEFETRNASPYTVTSSLCLGRNVDISSKHTNFFFQFEVPLGVKIKNPTITVSDKNGTTIPFVNDGTDLMFVSGADPNHTNMGYKMDVEQCKTGPVLVMINVIGNKNPVTDVNETWINGSDIDLCKYMGANAQLIRIVVPWTILTGDDGVTLSVGAITNTPQGPTCGSSVPGIGWIFCPVINLLSELGDWMWKIVMALLTVNPLQQTNTVTGTADTSYIIWGKIRDLANIAFAIIALIMIFSQVSSIGLSNYGIKKLLPRLIIGAIMVNLSFFVVQIAVDLANILGSGLYKLLSDMVPDLTFNWKTLIDEIIGGGLALGVVATVALSGQAAVVLYTMAPFILMGVLGVLAALLTLIFRQAMITILAVIAPLAIVAYLLPNTESWFKKWSGAFISMLMLYPLAALLFGGVRIAAELIGGAGSPWWGRFMAMIMLTLPLFSLPFLARQGGPLLGKVSGALSGMAGNARKPIGAWAGKNKERAQTSGDLRAFNNKSKGSNFRRFMVQRRAKIAGIDQNQQTELNRSKIKYVAGEVGTNPDFVNKMARNAGPEAEGRAEARAISELTKLKQEEVASEVIRITDLEKPEDLTAAALKLFDNSAKNNDITKFRAAQSILLQNSEGKKLFHEALANDTNGIMDAINSNTAMSNEFRGDLNKAGLKPSDAGIAKLGYTGGKLSDIDKDVKTYGDLTDAEILSQTSYVFNEILIKNHRIKPEAAIRILTSDTLKPTVEQRRLLETIGGAPASTVTPSYTPTGGASTSPIPPGYTQTGGGLIIPHSTHSPAGTSPNQGPSPGGGGTGTPPNQGNQGPSSGGGGI